MTHVMDKLIGNLYLIENQFRTVTNINETYFDMLIDDAIRNFNELLGKTSKSSGIIESTIEILKREKVDISSFEAYQSQCNKLSNIIGTTRSLIENIS